jgi:hypothetical protein
MKPPTRSSLAVMNNPEARTSVVLPDKRPLPSLVTDVERLKNQGAHPPSELLIPAPAAPDSDEDFLAKCRAGQLSSWSHDAYLRVVFW